MQLRDLAFGNGDKRDREKRRPLEQRGGILKVSVESIKPSASTTSNLCCCASCISACRPDLNFVAPVILRSAYSAETVQSRPFANARHRRT
jgi:hypothetical protein